jgi:hypothetical protein
MKMDEKVTYPDDPPRVPWSASEEEVSQRIRSDGEVPGVSERELVGTVVDKTAGTPYVAGEASLLVKSEGKIVPLTVRGVSPRVIKDLKRGEEVRATYVVQGTENVARSIQPQSAPEPRQ